MTHADGRTLRQTGALRLVALPGEDGRARYCIMDGPEPLATYPTLERALAAFEAVSEATDEATDEATHRRQLAASGVTDLTTYRLQRHRRRRGGATQGHHPSGTEAP